MSIRTFITNRTDSINRTVQRRMLFWSIGFFIVAIAALSVAIFQLGQTEIVNQTRQRNVQLASVISRDINSQISNIYTDTRTFSRLLENTSDSLASQAEIVLALRLSAPQRYRAVYYFDNQGSLLFQLADTIQNLYIIKNGEEIVSRPIIPVKDEIMSTFDDTQGSITAVSEVYFQGFETVPVLYVGMPITTLGGDTRVIIFEIELSDIWQRIDLSTVGNTGFTYAVSRTGTIINYPNASFIGTIIPSEIQPLLGGYEGFTQYKEPSDNRLVVAAYSPVGGLTGWGIVVVQDKAEINASILRIGFSIIGIALILAVVGVFGILFMIRTFTRPITDLTQVTHRIAETGDLTETGLEIRPDEVGQLNEAFNLMIERLKKSEDRIAQAAIEERNRLARDLHDAVSQTLFSASLIAEVLPRIWARNPQDGQKRLEELRQLTRGALAEMRTLLLELRPAALEEAEISHLLRQLGESIAGRTRIPVEVKIDGECNASSEAKIAFYRISQEALNNVAKHSGATLVNVSLICSETDVILTISDNGRGFYVEGNLQKSLGLGIIQERSKEIGATLQINSEMGKGTDIKVIWKKAHNI